MSSASCSLDRKTSSCLARPAPMHRQKAQGLFSKGSLCPETCWGRGGLRGVWSGSSWLLGWLFPRSQSQMSPSWAATALARHVRTMINVHHARHEALPSDSLGDPKPLSRLSGMTKPPTSDNLVPALGASEILSASKNYTKTWAVPAEKMHLLSFHLNQFSELSST